MSRCQKIHGIIYVLLLEPYLLNCREGLLWLGLVSSVVRN